MRFAGALRNILRPLSLSSSTPLTSQISTTLPFHAPFPSYSKPPQFLLPFLNHFHTLTDTRFPKRRPSDKPRRKRASLRPSGPYAWVEHTTGETILPNKPNEGSVKRRNEKKRMRQRRAFILVTSPFTCYYTMNLGLFLNTDRLFCWWLTKIASLMFVKDSVVLFIVQPDPLISKSITCLITALQDLYRSLNNPQGLHGWNGGDPCEEYWTGVACSDSSVIHL
ncbi:hypothetical protein KIW84_054278 [Lathyrus oleraceus]|uniref:Leucine-rich repeat-containing N-terminal plant-type domain-containing protein n=1 Tax=Pisum sativum TaxID=3888 RepID=A0A9D4WX90_PEA|nr:hypothetical protein KIW84_054278 [Pisum sativum]